MNSLLTKGEGDDAIDDLDLELPQAMRPTDLDGHAAVAQVLESLIVPSLYCGKDCDNHFFSTCKDLWRPGLRSRLGRHTQKR
jgi:hypothetical protein